MTLGQSVSHDSRVTKELLDSWSNLFFIPVDQTHSDQVVKDVIVVVRSLPGLVRLKRPHSVKPNIVVKSKIRQLELPPISRIRLGSQVLNLGKIRLEELISTNRTYLGWTPIALGLPGRVELAN